MLDIGVYTTKEVLEHKQKDGMSPDNYCFWRVRSANVEWGDKIWFAVGGRWVGYFKIIAFTDGIDMEFHSDSWVSVDGPPRKPFRGFTYNVPKIPVDGGVLK